MDLYLSFPDEETANTVLGKTEDGQYAFNGVIDVIGVIYKPTGVMLTNDDGEYPEMQAIPGWHVNARGYPTKAVKAYAVTVDTPVRVWA